MKKLIFPLGSDARYVVFTACPDVLIINVSVPLSRVARLYFDRSPLPPSTVDRLRRTAK